MNHPVKDVPKKQEVEAMTLEDAAAVLTDCPESQYFMHANPNIPSD